eukprot:CAMPEP_0178458610 /NCGR_PEP_ID=MMETSP0689_2-20121128/47636_1 /TAXON_ID=160604 /ORGANISM="Amphidinium massartii, Strain CS-259" /LENGTH=165 /DNA_ID=CAMNT_0020084927 /DNA_START=60 /DNA_END=559 /DNA_ORIENTATION=-
MLTLFTCGVTGNVTRIGHGKLHLDSASRSVTASITVLTGLSLSCGYDEGKRMFAIRWPSASRPSRELIEAREPKTAVCAKTSHPHHAMITPLLEESSMTAATRDMRDVLLSEAEDLARIEPLPLRLSSTNMLVLSAASFFLRMLRPHQEAVVAEDMVSIAAKDYH